MNDKIKKQLISFFEKNELVKYKKGQIIFKPGDKISGVLFDKSGYVRVYKVAKDGKEITLPMLKPLFFCSLTDVLLKKENAYYIEAISPVEFWMSPEKEFVEYLEKDVELDRKLNKILLSDFVDLTNNIQHLVFGDACAKIASLIYNMSTKFGEKRDKEETIIDFNTPHRILASMTGLTRETVTLQILKLQKEGILYNKGRKIVIKDTERLREKAQI